MKIAMVTEGTYPQSFGGVSVWCDQLVRGMSRIDFQVHAISASGLETPAWDLPGNVTLTRIPIWSNELPGQHRRAGIQTRRKARRTCDTLLRGLLAPTDGSAKTTAEVTGALRQLVDLASPTAVSRALHADESVEALIDAWRAGPGADGVAMSVFDAVSVLGVLEHWLRPLVRSAPRVDVTHAVTNGLAALVGLSAKWRFCTPLLLTEHGVYLRERYLGLREGCHSWPVKVVLLNFMRHICSATYQEADLVTTVNKYNQRWERRGGAAAERIRTIYNGVDPDSFPAAGTEPDVPTVIWVGRIDPLKDIETLLRAFALVRDEVPAARLRIFGGTPEGNEDYLARCRTLVGQLGITGAVAFEGRTERVRDAYAAGHVVVLSSISEGLPYTVIEAMATGRATVSTDVGGVAEAVGQAGTVVPPRDPAALAEACLRLLGDDRLRTGLAASARRRVLECFTTEKTVSAFDSIYNELAGSGMTGSFRRKPITIQQRSGRRDGRRGALSAAQPTLRPAAPRQLRAGDQAPAQSPASAQIATAAPSPAPAPSPSQGSAKVPSQGPTRTPGGKLTGQRSR